MLDRFFANPDDLACFRVSGLGDVLDDVAAYLHRGGYCPAVARSYLSIAGHFSHWLDLEGIGPKGLDADIATRFQKEHLPVCRCSGRRGMQVHLRAALDHVMAALNNRGWLAPLPVVPERPVDQFLHRFDTYLDHTCGATPATRRLYTSYARGFLDKFFGVDAVDLDVLTPKELIDFISEQARERSPETAKVIRTALRSVLRFAQFEGACDGRLAAAIPRVAHWKRARLPRALSEQQLGILLSAFDRSTALGRRDYVMTLCMTQLGLRAGEVAALTFDDIDWRSGTLQLRRTKGRRSSILPLPTPLGREIVSYLRQDRPQIKSRQVFVRSQAPFDKPLTSDSIRAVVRRAFARAGLDLASHGAHVLRHTAATRMVRAGATLKEVADLLRHRSLETVMIYTKLDLPTLTAVAHPWPRVLS